MYLCEPLPIPKHVVLALPELALRNRQLTLSASSARLFMSPHFDTWSTTEGYTSKEISAFSLMHQEEYVTPEQTTYQETRRE